jgi:hypothetical protein
MSMNVIGETVKAWLLSLAALLAPSTVFVVTNTCLVLPWLGFGFDTTPLSAANILLILIASLMLHAFNLPLIRFFEGYVRMPSGLDKFLRQRQLAQHMDLMKRQARHLDYDLFVDFPTRPERVLPTRFGVTVQGVGAVGSREGAGRPQLAASQASVR